MPNRSPAPRYVAVVGPGAAQATPLLLTVAAQVAAAIVADLGAVVVCGGLGGVMAAAARGAREAGGTTLGILPGEDRSVGNEDLTVTVPSGLGELRDGLVVRASDAVVAVGGSWGTAVEIAFAMKIGRPVVCLHGWQVLDADRMPVPGIEHAATVADAVRFVRERLRWTPTGGPAVT